MTPPNPPTPPSPPGGPGNVDPGEVAAKDWMQVTGLVTSRQMAALSRQIWYLTQWGIFLSKVDWSQIPMLEDDGGGGGITPPPKPPGWPP